MQTSAGVLLSSSVLCISKWHQDPGALKVRSLGAILDTSLSPAPISSPPAHPVAATSKLSLLSHHVSSNQIKLLIIMSHILVKVAIFYVSFLSGKILAKY